MNAITQKSLILVFVLAASPVRAEEWKMPNLNPFSGASTEKKVGKSSYKFTGEKKSWIPSLPSMGKSTTATPSNGPTMWQRVQKTPSTIANKTGEMMTKTKNSMASLNPYREEKKPSVPWGQTTTRSADGKEEKKGMFSWMQPKEEPKQPETMADWIAAPRPE